jgi:hypothetical protein
VFDNAFRFIAIPFTAGEKENLKEPLLSPAPALKPFVIPQKEMILASPVEVVVTVTSGLPLVPG